MRNKLIILLLLISNTIIGQYFPQIIDTNNQIYHKNGYIVSYNEFCEQPNWVYYTIKKSDFEGVKYDRDFIFKEDTAVKTGSASPNDYKNTGYDRGHLKASNDEPTDSIQMKETFLMSNISPQAPSFNRGVWLRLENYVRTKASESDSLIVITGGILDDSLTTIGKNKVCVPTNFFKVLYIFNYDSVIIECFVMPNMKSDYSIFYFQTSLEFVEKKSNLKFIKP